MRSYFVDGAFLRLLAAPPNPNQQGQHFRMDFESSSPIFEVVLVCTLNALCALIRYLFLFSSEMSVSAC